MAATAKSNALIRLLYGSFAWLILVFVVLPVAAGLLLVPGLKRRRAIARWGAATTFRAIGSPVQIKGRPIDRTSHSIIVANHSSYLDGIILTAVLPPEYTFLIKREMTAVPVASFVLRRLGSEFVDRASADQRHRSGRRLLQAAVDGDPLAVFPEGTFDAEPGLKPFHMGAFRVAWRANLRVVPLIIHGARAKLPSGSLLPQPGPLTVEFCSPIQARDHADKEALLLAVRRTILEKLDEPDLETPTAHISE